MQDPDSFSGITYETVPSESSPWLFSRSTLPSKIRLAPSRFGGVAAAPSADPFLVVEREGSAVGAVCLPVLLTLQGESKIAKSNRMNSGLLELSEATAS